MVFFSHKPQIKLILQPGKLESLNCCLLWALCVASHDAGFECSLPHRRIWYQNLLQHYCCPLKKFQWALLEKNKTWQTINITSTKMTAYLLKNGSNSNPSFVLAFMMMGDGDCLLFLFLFSSPPLCVSSSQASPPLPCCFVISPLRVRSHSPPFTLISFLAARPRQRAGRVASAYSGHDAAGERIREGGGGTPEQRRLSGCHGDRRSQPSAAVQVNVYLYMGF